MPRLSLSPMTCAFILILLYELEEGIQFPATIHLIENSICQRYFAGRLDGLPPTDELSCKIAPVQHKLAYVRGWYSVFSTVPVLFLGTFFGTIADKTGRRPVFAMTVIGMIAALGMVYVICTCWRTAKPELLWLIFLPRLIGGGAFVAIALYMAIVADLSTETDRGSNFYKAFCVKLISDLVSPQIAAAALNSSLWLPYLLAALCLAMMLPVLGIMSETLPESNRAELSLKLCKQSLIPSYNAYAKFFRQKKILLGLTIMLLVQFRYTQLQVLPPYISVRFGRKIAEASNLLSIIPGVGLVTLLCLPRLSRYVHERQDYSGPAFDRLFVRISALSLVIGTIFFAFTVKFRVFIFGLTIFAVGFNIRAPILSVLTSILSESHETAELYTLTSNVDAIGHIISSPVIESVWAKAVDLGGQWLALQFYVILGLFVMATLLTAQLSVGPNKPIEDAQRDPAEGDPQLRRV